MKGFTRAQVYKWALKQAGEFRSRDVGAAFGVSMDSASKMVRRLREDGVLALNSPRKTWQSRWRVIKRDVEISNHSGMHPNSLKNLEVQWVRRTGNSHPRTAKRIERYKTIELEKCWRLPTFSTVDRSADSCVNNGGPVRPEFDEAA